MKTLDERKAILEAEIVKQQRKGWQIVNRTDTTFQMTKEKKPDGCVTAILIILFVIPGILYLIFMKGTITVYVEITEDGEANYSDPNLSPYELSELKKDAPAGSVKVNIPSSNSNQSQEASKPSQELGFLTTKVIADGLKITEEEVIELIKSGQLRGKKIGEKYFVSKEDFDTFMKN